MFCLYLKFYETKINRLRNWEKVFSDIRKSAPYLSIYIWIESQKHPDELIEHNPYNLIFVTHANKKEFCKDIDKKDILVDNMSFSVGMNYGNHKICRAHMRSFFIPKEEFIYHLDGDDMFYLNLTYEMLLRGVKYMKQNNKTIIARPYWITVERGFSFGFILQKKSFADKLLYDIINNMPDEYKYEGFFNKNLDITKNMNCDNLFGMILFNYLKLNYKDVFFAFKESPDWHMALSINEPFINKITTKQFNEKYEIPLI